MAKATMKVTEKDLLAQIASLQEKLAAATASAAPTGTDATQLAELTKQLADASAEAAAARHRVDELIAQLADANADRSRLAALLEASHHDVSKHRASTTGHAAAPASAVVIDGPAVDVQTRPGREQTRWRCGRGFTREVVTIRLADLTEGELEALRGDRELVVIDHKPRQEV
jgi:hypothetical protein